MEGSWTPAKSAVSVTTRIGSTSNFGVNESDPVGLTYGDGRLIMIGGRNNTIYQLSTSSGRASRMLRSNSELAGVWSRTVLLGTRGTGT